MTGESPFQRRMAEELHTEQANQVAAETAQSVQEAALLVRRKASGDYRGSSIQNYLTDEECASAADFLQLLGSRGYPCIEQLGLKYSTQRQIKSVMGGLLKSKVELVRTTESEARAKGYKIGIAIPETTMPSSRMKEQGKRLTPYSRVGDYSDEYKKQAMLLNSKYYALAPQTTEYVYLCTDNKLHTETGGSVPPGYIVIPALALFTASRDSNHALAINRINGHVQLSLDTVLLAHAQEKKIYI